MMFGGRFEAFRTGGAAGHRFRAVALLCVGLALAGCSRSTSPPEPADSAGQSSSQTGQRATGGAGGGSKQPGSMAAGTTAAAAAAGTRAVAGGEGSGSVAATVARLEEALGQTSDAFFAGDVDALGPLLGTVRQSLGQLQSLLSRARIDPERSRTAAQAVTDLNACCAKAESRMRGGGEIDQAEMQAFAQRVEAALERLKTSTAGVP